MFKDYIINAAILITFISLVHQIYHPSGFSSLTSRLKLSMGAIMGILGIILMEFAVRIEESTRIDFRYIPIIITAVYAGCIPAFICGLMIGFARILLYGLTPSSIAGLIIIILVTVLALIVHHYSLKPWKAWMIIVLFTEASMCSAFFLVISSPELRIRSSVSYCVSYTVISILMYHYIRYLEQITESFRQCSIEVNKDFLTGLNNVRSFDSIYNAYLESAVAGSRPFSLIYIDIDFFKTVNDTYGHKEGDTVLTMLGKILVQSCRSIDMVSRNGGEEFSVILSDCLPDMALEIGERIRINVEKTPIILTDGTFINITVSLGIASYPHPINDFTKLREKADWALYEAKRTGRNKVVAAAME